jgi:hypothetical protein
VIHICPRTEGNFEEDSADGEQSVPLQKMDQGSYKESRYSEETAVMKRGRVSASEEWLCNEESLQEGQADVGILRKQPSLDIDKRCEDNGIDRKDVEVPAIRMHHVRGDDNEGRIIDICNQINMGFVNRLSAMLKFTCI